MTRGCLNTYIQDVQCKYKELANDTAKALSINRGDLKCKIRDTRIIDSYLDSMYYYVPFEQEVTYAHKFEIKRTDSQSITIEIHIGGKIFSHTGSGDARSFAKELYKQVENNTQVPNYRAEFEGNTLYIYSYDTSTNFSVNTTVNIIQGSDQDNSVAITDLESKLDQILDTWNCLTNQEICQIIDHARDMLKEEC